MSDLMPFAFEEVEVRATQDESGDVWFVAKDVAAALGIMWNGKLLDQIPDQWKGMRSFLTPGGEQSLTTINEAGLYKLAFRSNKPQAERFTNWVASEVLPSIRKTGSYVHPGAPAPEKHPISGMVKVNRLYLSMLAVAKQIFPDKNQALLSADKATRKATGTSPLAMLDATHLVATFQTRIMTPTEIGREFGMSAIKANKLLEACGIQEQDTNKQWMPTSAGAAYAVFLDTGKSHGDGTPVRQLKWNSDVLSAVRGFVAGQEA